MDRHAQNLESEISEDESGDDASAALMASAMSAIDVDSPPSEAMALGEAEASSESEGLIRSGKLVGKSMWAAIWILALPVLLQQFMGACVGLVDKVLAGNLPKAIVVPALDAIGIGTYVGWLIGIAMTGLGIGGQALIARSMGAGEVHRAGRVLGQAISLSFVWGVLVAGAMWVTAGPLGRMCGLHDQALAFCVQYVHVIALAMPCTGIMFVGQMCLHGAGETTRPSLIAIGVNIINIFLAWGLSGANVQLGGHVYTNPIGLNWNVFGIATGTALSSVCGAVMTLIVLKRGVKDMKLDLHTLKPDGRIIGRILYLGVPSFFEGLAMWGVSAFVLKFIGNIAQSAGENGTGEGLQGAHIIAVQWESLSFLPGFAMGTAAGALAGQYLGARNPRLAQRCIIACTGVACAIMGFMGVLFMTQGAALTSLISREPVHQHHTPKLLAIAGMVQVVFAIYIVISKSLRGVGDSIWPFMMTSACSYLIRLPAAWFLGVHMGLGIEGIWYGLCGELVIRCAVFTARFVHGGWKRLRV